MGMTFWLQTNVGVDIRPDGSAFGDFRWFCELVGAGAARHEPTAVLQQLAVQEGLPLDPLIRVTGLPVDLDAVRTMLPAEMPEDERAAILANLAAHNGWAEHCWQEIAIFRPVLEHWVRVLDGSVAENFYNPIDPPVMRAIMLDAAESVLVLVNTAEEQGATQVRMCAEW